MYYVNGKGNVFVDIRMLSSMGITATFIHRPAGEEALGGGGGGGLRKRNIVKICQTFLSILYTFTTSHLLVSIGACLYSCTSERELG